MNEKRARIELFVSMVIFGTIGIFVKHIPLPSGMIAAVRGIGGMLFLILLVALKKERISKEAIKENLTVLILSGVFIAINWILLFEAYRYTTVATATLCYYLAPVFVILVSPILLKERLTVKKVICILCALVGMVFVSGVLDTGISGFGEVKGILLGIGAAVFYASVILLNKKLKNINAYDKTIVQLGVAGISILPYTLLCETASVQITPFVILMLIIVAIVHTGFSYAMYFGSIKELPAQSVAIFSYTDPVVAIILSAALLGETMTVFGVIGAVLILGSTLVSEIS